MVIRKIVLSVILTFSMYAGFGQKVVFYLHGRIVENQGAHAIDTINGYGQYKYQDIIDSLKKRNFTVISEVRKPKTNVTSYARLVAHQIDSLLKKNIDPKNITVIGASKGSIIAMYVSTYVKNDHINYVFMAGCEDETYAQCSDILFHGNVLSIYEKSDSLNAGSCMKFKNRSGAIPHYQEIELNTGLRHGFIFRPLNEWLDPATQWANNNYDMNAAKNQKLLINHLTDNFYVFTTYQNYKGNPVSSNGLYVVTNDGVIMIDSPWDTSQCQPLLDSIEKKHQKKVVLCIATHSHADRTGGLSYYRQKGIKTYTSKQTDSISGKSGENRAQSVFQKDTVFKVGQYSFQTCYAGAGHTSDNIFIWFNNNKVLYGGCAIKSYEADDLGYIGEANLKAWPLTLKKIKQKFPDPKFIIPGHQDWRSLQSIDHTLELLRSHK